MTVLIPLSGIVAALLFGLSKRFWRQPGKQDAGVIFIVFSIGVLALGTMAWLKNMLPSDSAAVKECIRMTKDTSNDHSLDFVPGAGIDDMNRMAAAACRSTGGPGLDTSTTTGE
jgi:hypothetical protein